MAIYFNENVQAPQWLFYLLWEKEVKLDGIRSYAFNIRPMTFVPLKLVLRIFFELMIIQMGRLFPFVKHKGFILSMAKLA